MSLEKPEQNGAHGHSHDIDLDGDNSFEVSLIKYTHIILSFLVYLIDLHGNGGL